MAKQELNGKFILAINDKVVEEKPIESMVVLPNLCNTCQHPLAEDQTNYCNTCQPIINDITELMHDPLWCHAIRNIVNDWSMKEQVEKIQRERASKP